MMKFFLPLLAGLFLFLHAAHAQKVCDFASGAPVAAADYLTISKNCAGTRKVSAADIATYVYDTAPGTNGQIFYRSGGTVVTGTAAAVRVLLGLAPVAASGSYEDLTDIPAYDADDIDDTSTSHKFVTSADLTKLSNLSGTNTGDQTSITGNAGTATSLQNARTINGVSFNGTANITIPVPATFGTTFGGSPITTGSKGYAIIPTDMTVTGWTLVADQSGSIVVDIKRATYSGFPTTSSIAGSEKPTLSSAQKNRDVSLSSWTTSLTAGDVIEFVVDSVSGVQRVNLVVHGVK